MAGGGLGIAEGGGEVFWLNAGRPKVLTGAARCFLFAVRMALPALPGKTSRCPAWIG